MMDILLSIIIPAYNTSAYLPRCLDSVLAQTYKNIEIIIIDDGSQDNAAEIAEDYARRDPRIRLLRQENAGVVAARKTGIEAAKGDYVGFVDSDDAIDADMYELLIGNAIKHNADISHCGYRMVFPSRTVPYYGTGRLVLQTRFEGVRDLLSGVFIEPGLWNKIYRRGLFDGVEFDTSIRNLEDLLINYQLFARSKSAVFQDEPKYQYILRSGSASTGNASEAILLDALKVGERIAALAECDDELAQLGAAKRIRMYQTVLKGAMMSKEASVRRLIPEIKRRIQARAQDVSLLERKGRYLLMCMLKAPFAFRVMQWVNDTIKGNRDKYKVE